MKITASEGRAACRGLACFALVLSLAACSTAPDRSPKGIDHIVIVWLKRPGNKDDKTRLIATSKEMQGKLPVIRAVSYGSPVASGRPVVDDSFDLAFVMRFDNRKDLADYEGSPVHQRAAREILGPLSRKIVIYDIGNE